MRTVLAEIIFLNAQDYFRTLVTEGCEKKKLALEPYLQSYVVHVLQDYVDASKLEQSETLAEVYLKAQVESEPVKSRLLKSLGERALYISGFFGESLSRKIVDIDYYIQMGASAYSLLSHARNENTHHQLYKTVSNRFLDLVELLNYISEKSYVHSDTNIMRLYEKYLLTGSNSAREKLLEMGILSLPLDQVKLGKQG